MNTDPTPESFQRPALRVVPDDGTLAPPEPEPEPEPAVWPEGVPVDLEEARVVAENMAIEEILAESRQLMRARAAAMMTVGEIVYFPGAYVEEQARRRGLAGLEARMGVLPRNRTPQLMPDQDTLF